MNTKITTTDTTTDTEQRDNHMNTASITNDTIETTKDRTETGPRRRCGRRLAGAVAGVLLAAGTMVIGAGAQPAQAMDIGGGFLNDTYLPTQYWTAPGSFGVQVACSPGVIRIYPYANVLAGYTSQYLTYRFHVTNSAGYTGTSGWVTPSVRVPGVEGNQTNPMKWLTPFTWSVRTGVTWTVQVQIAYQTTWGWAYSQQWASPQGYSYNGYGNWARCST